MATYNTLSSRSRVSASLFQKRMSSLSRRSEPSTDSLLSHSAKMAAIDYCSLRNSSVDWYTVKRNVCETFGEFPHSNYPCFPMALEVSFYKLWGETLRDGRKITPMLWAEWVQKEIDELFRFYELH